MQLAAKEKEIKKENWYWKDFEKSLVSRVFPEAKISQTPNYHQVVSVLCDDQGKPYFGNLDLNVSPSYFIFSDSNKAARLERPLGFPEMFEALEPTAGHLIPKLKTFMLGSLIESVADNSEIRPIRFNSIWSKRDNNEEDILLNEEVLFIPLLDKLTGKKLISDPEDALALMAIQKEDEIRLGMRNVFYCLTNRSLPEDKEDREQILAAELEKLAFLLPRVPVAKGSSGLLLVLLNLENKMEEMAFIRPYEPLDEHVEILFVTSELEILSGDLERIPYDGSRIDTIYLPILEWQKRNQSSQLAKNR